MLEIIGKVIHGEGYGQKLGFPTANLDRRDFSRRRLKVKLGVWAGVAKIESNIPSPHPLPQGRGENVKIYKAGIVIGPMDKYYLPKIEAHLIGFKGNLYGKYLNIYLYRYIRPFKKFKNEEALKQQIKLDIQRVRELELKK